jgi:hypothetical protein
MRVQINFDDAGMDSSDSRSAVERVFTQLGHELKLPKAPLIHGSTPSTSVSIHLSTTQALNALAPSYSLPTLRSKNQALPPARTPDDTPDSQNVENPAKRQR